MDFDLEPVVQSAIKVWAVEANARNYKGGQYDNFHSPNIIYYTDIQKSNHRPYNLCRKHGNRIQ